jgi:hypothetical protein
MVREAEMSSSLKIATLALNTFFSLRRKMDWQSGRSGRFGLISALMTARHPMAAKEGEKVATVGTLTQDDLAYLQKWPRQPESRPHHT